jgi:tRNA-Thr(GGU) m(6)t(6)A37 methyltransferase TsaA
MAGEVTYQYIGRIHTPFTCKPETPIQGIYAPDSIGTVEVFPEYAEGLQDLEGFSHLILLYHFHRAEPCSLLKKPFLDDEPKGIFAIRHFNRPNPLGLSVVRLEKIEGNVLTVGEIDVLNDTPLLDIKPYMPDFDIRDRTREGWYKGASNREYYDNLRGG